LLRLGGGEIVLALTLLFKKLQVEMLKIHSLVLSLGGNLIHPGHRIHADSPSVFAPYFVHKRFHPNTVAERADGSSAP
jgi:hypothetical protein